MQVSDKIRSMLKRDEGLRFRLYRCTAGKLSIGYGRNIEDNGISLAVAELMLQEDLIIAEVACRRAFGDLLWNAWSENRKLGWINFGYNLGEVTLLTFRNTLKAARAQDWKGVEAGLRASLWFRQVKERAPRVIAMICKEQFPYG